LENQENISHLIKILRRMSSSEIGWILRDMSEDFQFEPKILNFLCKELFSPLLLISELSEGDLEVLLKSLPQSIVKFLYIKYLEFRKPILNIYDSKKLKSISDKNISEEESANIIIEEVLKLYESRKISYNGIILNFNFPVCVKKNLNHDDLYFLVLEDVLQCNKIIRILIISRKLAGYKCQIQFENSEKEILNQKIFLDVWGYYYGEFKIDSLDGLIKINLIYQDKVISQRDLILLKEAESHLIIKNFNLKEDNKKIYGEGFLYNKLGKKITSEIKYIVYCKDCGLALQFGKADIRDNKISISFVKSEKALGHSKKYFIYFKSESDEVICIPKYSSSSKKRSIQTQAFRRSTEDIEISEKLKYGTRYLILISSDLLTLDELALNIESSQDLEIAYNLDKKGVISPFEKSYTEDQLKLFGVKNQNYRVVLHSITEENLDLKISTINEENINSLYIDIYEINSTLEYILRAYSPLDDSTQVYSENSNQIEGEEGLVNVYCSKNYSKEWKIKYPREKIIKEIKIEYYIKYSEEMKIEIDSKDYIFKNENKTNKYESYEITNSSEKSINIENLLKEIENSFFNRSGNNFFDILVMVYYLLKKYKINKENYIKEKIDYLFQKIKEYDSEGIHYSLTDYSVLESWEEIIKEINYEYQNLLEYIQYYRERILYFQNYSVENKIKTEDYIYNNLYKILKYDGMDLTLIDNNFSFIEVKINLLIILISKNIDSIEVQRSTSESKKIKKSSGFNRILELLGFKSKKISYIKKIRKIKIENIKKKLIQNLEFNLASNSTELHNISKLFELIRIGNNSRKTEERFFISKNSNNIENQYEPYTKYFKIDKFSFLIGEIASISLLNTLEKYSLVEIKFPYFLSVLNSNYLNKKDYNSLLIDPSYFLQNKLFFIALKKGKGSLIINIFSGISSFKTFTIGIVEVK
jgi:hypothetical protein